MDRPDPTAPARTFLGAGWDFPPARGDAVGTPGQAAGRPAGAAGAAAPHGARFALARAEDSVRQSIWIILSTARGERLMRPRFGCGIHELVFAPNSAATRGLAEFEVREALRAFEPRIDVLDVRVAAGGRHGEQLLVDIDYRVRATDSRFNLVYPFYLDRGMR